MNAPVVGWLDDSIRADWSILELGSGASSIWFAERTEHLVSLEHDPDWYESSRKNFADAGLTNVDLQLCERYKFPQKVEELPVESFDLVVVDHLDGPELERPRSVELVKSLVKPGGYLLLDDSDRPDYGRVDDVLSDWDRRRFLGFKNDGFILAVETTVYRRPA